jgi:hypothetical protein
LRRRAGRAAPRAANRGTLVDGPSSTLPAAATRWTEALQPMPVGSKWRLYMPAELGYGERGAGQDIGPHAALVFEVELLGIEPRQAVGCRCSSVRCRAVVATSRFSGPVVNLRARVRA